MPLFLPVLCSTYTFLHHLFSTVHLKVQGGNSISVVVLQPCYCLLSLFHTCRPAELEQLVCGGRVVDLSALQAATQYDDGYNQHSTPIRWFWEVRNCQWACSSNGLDNCGACLLQQGST
jgi:hypothetical protein